MVSRPEYGNLREEVLPSKKDYRSNKNQMSFVPIHFWQVGQKWVLRPPTTMRSMGVEQVRQGSPVRE